jgi:hypothetical protein
MLREIIDQGGKGGRIRAISGGKVIHKLVETVDQLSGVLEQSDRRAGRALARGGFCRSLGLALQLLKGYDQLLYNMAYGQNNCSKRQFSQRLYYFT